MEKNELNVNAKGGTELLMERLYAALPSELLEQFQIIPTRVRELDESKFRILWIHDLASDPETNHLRNGGWERFHYIVFVSYHQMNQFVQKYNIPYSKCIVLYNSIKPIDDTIDTKFSAPYIDKNGIKLIYTSTPHRGLELLYPVFHQLSKDYENISLDVYSSFNLYGWSDRDKQFEHLFNLMKDHPKINYHGTVPNDEVRKAVADSHIFAYPSIWEETSCLSMIEAMSGGNICVHSTLGALPETAGSTTAMYMFTEDHQEHMNRFYGSLKQIIENLINLKDYARLGKIRADTTFNEQIIMHNWKVILEGIIRQNPDRNFPKLVQSSGFNLNIV